MELKDDIKAATDKEVAAFPLSKPARDKFPMTLQASPHIFILLGDTTSFGENDDNRDIVKVDSKEGDLSWRLDVVTIA